MVAETDVQAKRAIEKIRITYEDLEPVIFTIEVGTNGRSHPRVVESIICVTMLTQDEVRDLFFFLTLAGSGKISFLAKVLFV